MKILIVCDSFKGSLTSEEVCSCIKKSLEETDKTNEISCVPFSDGGEGFSDCMQKACNGKVLYTQCSDTYGKIKKCSYTVFDKTAVIETATASGLCKVKRIEASTSYGTGELIKHAVLNGYNNIILGLGGSGFCDGGTGALSALGAIFLDENQQQINVMHSGDMNYVFGLNLRSVVKPIIFTYACDVNNPYFGKNGCAHVFAPQKGANESQVKTLDDGLKRINAFLPHDISALPGAGAAGGLCGGLYSVYGGKIESGFDILSKYSNLEEKIANADLVVTGEGRTDSQTLMGKLPFKISSLCSKLGKRCIVISGSIQNVELGDKMISLTDENINEQTAITHAYEILFKKAKLILQ